MDIGAILLFLAVLVVTVFFIARPLLEIRPPAAAGGGHELSALMAERDSIITALQELDFDNSLGKIPVEDYPQQRAVLLQHGAKCFGKSIVSRPEPPPRVRLKNE